MEKLINISLIGIVAILIILLFDISPRISDLETKYNKIQERIYILEIQDDLIDKCGEYIDTYEPWDDFEIKMNIYCRVIDSKNHKWKNMHYKTLKAIME